MRLAALLFLLATPAAAQDLDCTGAMVQSELNQCAWDEWQAQDALLNQAYAEALAVLEDWDAALPEAERGGPEALRAAQRAWITYRDRACETEGYAMKGGSAEPLLVYSCRARLTEERTGHLLDIARFGG